MVTLVPLWRDAGENCVGSLADHRPPTTAEYGAVGIFVDISEADSRSDCKNYPLLDTWASSLQAKVLQGTSSLLD